MPFLLVSVVGGGNVVVVAAKRRAVIFGFDRSFLEVVGARNTNNPHRLLSFFGKRISFDSRHRIGRFCFRTTVVIIITTLWTTMFPIGYVAAFVSCVAFGSFAVPIKGKTANRVNIDPLGERDNTYE